MTATPVPTTEWYLGVGKVIHYSSAADMVLVNAFALLAGVDTPKARAIVYAADAFNTRKQMITRLLSSSHHTDAVRDAVKVLLNAVEKANKVRQEIAHTF